MVYNYFLKGAYILITTSNFVVATRTVKKIIKSEDVHEHVVVFRFHRVRRCLLFHRVFFLLASNFLNSSVVVIVFGTIEKKVWKKFKRKPRRKKEGQDTDCSSNI